jgi:hypothetical protein
MRRSGKEDSTPPWVTVGAVWAWVGRGRRKEEGGRRVRRAVRSAAARRSVNPVKRFSFDSSG